MLYSGGKKGWSNSVLELVLLVHSGRRRRGRRGNCPPTFESGGGGGGGLLFYISLLGLLYGCMPVENLQLNFVAHGSYSGLS